MTGDWVVERHSGPAAALHEESARLAGTHAPARTCRLLEATSDALVLGSAQPEGDADPPAGKSSPLLLLRRRSGGGAVLVGPGRLVWADLLIPRGDPLWDDDVARAAWWVGEAWAAALTASGSVPSPEVWRGPMRPGRLGRRVCFAGVGPGEVLWEGRKVVGVSQRRTRTAALFQTAALVEWDPSALAGPLRLREDEVAELESCAVGVGPARAAALREALVGVLVP